MQVYFSQWFLIISAVFGDKVVTFRKEHFYVKIGFFHKALRRKSFHYLLSEACIVIFSIWKSIFLPSQALYYTVELCIKSKIYVLSDIYICKTVFLTAVLNWIKLFVCMMLLPSLIFFLLSWESGRFCCLPRGH